MKKIFSVLCALSLAMGTVGYAQINVSEIVSADGTVRIEGTASPNEKVTVRFQKADAEARDFDNVYALKEAVSDSKGNFEFEFLMPDTDSEEQTTKGMYKVFITSSANGRKTDAEELTFEYFSKEERETLFASIKQAIENEDVNELKRIFTTEEDAKLLNVGISSVLVDTVNNDVVSECARLIVLNAEPSELNETELRRLTEIYGVIAYVNKASEIEGVLEKANPSFGGKEYVDLTNKEAEFVVEALIKNRLYNNEVEFENGCEKVSVLYAINTAKYTDIGSRIENNADLLGISDSEIYRKYASYNANKKKQIGKIMINYLEDDKVLCSDDLLELIEKASKDYDKNDKDGGGSGSGTGGFNGGTGNVTVAAGTQFGNTIAFADVSQNHWANKYIIQLAQKNIVSGYSDNTFKPDANITREEFVKMLISALGKNVEGTDTGFSDVDENAWYAKYVAVAARDGIVAGLPGNMFGVGTYITREDAAVMVCRAAGFNEYRDVDVIDKDEISEYAYSSVMALYNKGVLAGDTNGRFMPKSNITRAEAAKILCCAFGEN